MTTEISNQRFSVFPCGWQREDGTAKMHQWPQQTVTIGYCYRWITSPLCAFVQTKGYRAKLPTASREEKRDYKILNFEYATFSGIFSYRDSKAYNLIERSPFLTIDIDHLASTQEAIDVRRMLSEDQKVVTALCFVSPSGLGVKWVLELPEWTEGLSFKDQFDAMRNHLNFHYGLDADTSGSDVCRACYLPYDPDCYVNPKYVQL